MTRWTRTLTYYRSRRSRRLGDDARRVAAENWKLAHWCAARACRHLPGLHPDDALSLGHDALMAGVEAWWRKGRRAGKRLSTFVSWQLRSLIHAEAQRRDAGRRFGPLHGGLADPGAARRREADEAAELVAAAAARVPKQYREAVALILGGVPRGELAARLGRGGSSPGYGRWVGQQAVRALRRAAEEVLS